MIPEIEKELNNTLTLVKKELLKQAKSRKLGNISIWGTMVTCVLIIVYLGINLYGIFGG